MASNLQKFGAAAMALATVFGATAAHALEPGYCAPTATMSAALKEEGQRSLITGGRINLERPAHAQIFTSNAQGDGYLIEGDKPINATSERMCVMVKFSNLELFDARKEGVPQGALTGSRYDENLRIGDRTGSRVMLQGNVMQNGRPVALATVTGNLPERVGGMDFVISGNPEAKATFRSIDYTPTAYALLDRPVTTASLSMK